MVYPITAVCNHIEARSQPCGRAKRQKEGGGGGVRKV